MLPAATDAMQDAKMAATGWGQAARPAARFVWTNLFLSCVIAGKDI
jgi:hypothetical protein